MSRPAPFPHHYTVALEGEHLTAGPRPPILVGAPPQFGGTDQVWGPEELLVGAVLECLWTTFAAFARRDALSFDDWRGRGAGILDKGVKGPIFTSITLTVEVAVAAEDVERARALIGSAERHCIISNALNVPVKIEADVRARS